MNISMNWISEFVDLDGINIKELINKFTLSTAEVEGIHEFGSDVRNVVAAKVLSVVPHPNSKKLKIVMLDVGQIEAIQCVCGAPNVAEGIIVPFAMAGGNVKGIEISKCMLAGVESNGMCCSEKELGISDDHAGLMILDNSVKPGTDIKKVMQIDDIVFEVDNKSLTNRPDLWGHYGIAREIAALADRTLKAIDIFNSEDNSNLPDVNISVQDKERCLRYSGIIIKNITKKISPVNMRIRLFYCGMRSINLLADLTNYLMLELGQPMHAFDKELVGNISVRTFDNKFEFKTLDGVDRSIETGTLMICSDDKPVAIAGIMGGGNSEIQDSTDSILLESANFDGVSIRKSSTKLRLRTEASARYEKVIDPELTVQAIQRFIKLLLDIDPEIEIASKVTDVYVKKYDVINLQIERAFIDKYTGIEISDDKVIKTLKALGFTVDYENGIFDVTVPSFRATKDVTIKADLIEEITRIYGYDNFKLKTNKSDLVPVRHSIERDNEYTTKQVLAEQFSLNEVHSYIWYNTKLNKELGINTHDNVKIINSVSPESNVLRSTIIPTLLNMAYENKGNYSEYGFYEIGRVVKGLKNDNTCDERKSLGIILASKKSGEKELFFRMKEIVQTISSVLKNIEPDYNQMNVESEGNWLHPVNSASISYNGVELGYLSVLHPLIKDKIDKKLNIVYAEISFSDLSAITESPVKYKEISKYPGIEIDFSLLVDKNVEFSKLSEYIGEFNCEYLAKYELVDIFEDQKALGDQKSVTVRFYFVANDHTLSSEEVSKFTEELISLMNTKGIRLRY